ncbi:MAG: 50S ribosomal protein L31 [Chloroflexi bacterium]|nr:50S ribosomal protein L31 [Chloroflexota bacterium]
MREGIHPEWYPEATVICACGNTWLTGATKPELRTDVCAACHPFFTGEARIVDTEGQVERFMKRLRQREEILREQEEQAVEDEAPPEVAIEDLDLGSRYLNALIEAGITTASEFMAAYEEGGDEALLDIKGFGAKSLIDVKRQLRGMGYTFDTQQEEEDEDEPEEAEEA